MKSINPILASLLLVLTLFSCKEEIRNVHQKQTRSCISAICKGYREAELSGMLTSQTIKALSKSFARDPWKANIHGEKNQKDALSIVFDLEKIKALVYLMESAKCNNNCAKTYELGIRYYYIKYPSKIGHENPYPELANIDPDALNKHSLAMVPVYRQKGDSLWRDYNPWASTKDNCFPAVDFPVSNPKLKFRAVAPDAGENHGSIGPPPEPGTFGSQEAQ